MNKPCLAEQSVPSAVRPAMKHELEASLEGRYVVERKNQCGVWESSEGRGVCTHLNRSSRNGGVGRLTDSGR